MPGDLAIAHKIEDLDDQQDIVHYNILSSLLKGPSPGRIWTT